MRCVVIVTLLAAGLLSVPPLHAQDKQDKKVFEVTKIAENLFELSSDAGGYPEKIVASVGPDGLLIVDSGSRRTGEALVETLKSFGKGMPKIIICDMAVARRFLDMLRKTGDIVRAEMAKGKDLARLQADDVLKDYASYESAYVKRNHIVEYWYSAHAGPSPDRPKPYAPVIRTLQEKGAQAAMETYSELKRTRANDYWFDDMTLMYMGRRLYRVKRLDDARVFLERCIKEYAGSEGASVSHSVLALVFEQKGDLAQARPHLATYLEKHPEDAAARKKLAEIEAALRK